MKIVVNGEICDLAVCVFNFVTRFVVIANKSRLSVRFAILVKKNEKLQNTAERLRLYNSTFNVKNTRL